jgi:hypothetical protein
MTATALALKGTDADASVKAPLKGTRICACADVYLLYSSTVMMCPAYNYENCYVLSKKSRCVEHIIAHSFVDAVAIALDVRSRAM